MENIMTETPDDTNNRPVSLKQLAEELGFHTSSVRKTVVRRGFIPFRLSEEKNKPLFLSYEDADLFKQQIKNERDNAVVSKIGISPSRISGVYFIEVPSYEGAIRVKIGWSDSISERLSTYRTIIPDLRVKAVWQTTDAWCERAALKCAEKRGRRIHQELFEFEDIESVLFDLTDLFLKIGMENKHKDLFSNAQQGAQPDAAR